MRARRRAAGVTLIEVAVVLGLLGIAAGFTARFATARADRARLHEGQVVLAKAFERARGLARRFNEDYRVVVRRGAVDVVPGAAALAANPALPAFEDRPYGAGVVALAPLEVVFGAPFGRLWADDDVRVELEYRGPSGTYRAAVDLVGVTGKVVTRGIE